MKIAQVLMLILLLLKCPLLGAEEIIFPDVPFLYAGRGFLMFEQKMADFGHVTKGKVVSSRFKFINGAKRDVAIKSLVPDTSSVVALYEPQNMFFAPDEEGEVIVTVDTKNLLGQFISIVLVKTDHKIVPVYLLTVKMWVDDPNPT